MSTIIENLFLCMLSVVVCSTLCAYLQKTEITAGTNLIQTLNTYTNDSTSQFKKNISNQGLTNITYTSVTPLNSNTSL